MLKTLHTLCYTHPSSLFHYLLSYFLHLFAISVYLTLLDATHLLIAIQSVEGLMQRTSTTLRRQ